MVRVYLLKPVAKPASLQHGILFAATPQTSCSGSQLKVRSLPSIIPQGVLRSPFANLLKTVSPPALPFLPQPNVRMVRHTVSSAPLLFTSHSFLSRLRYLFFFGTKETFLIFLFPRGRRTSKPSLPAEGFSQDSQWLRSVKGWGGRAVLRGRCGCADRWGPPCLLPNGSGLCARRKRLQTVQDKTQLMPKLRAG